MQDTWLAELTRILKPRGVLLLTIYGKAARTSLDEDGQKMLQINGFVHRRSRKLKGLAPDWYQTSWHSREYVVSRLSPRFSEIRYSEIPDGQQDIVVGRRASP
jgi:hypothetical protein